MYLRNGKVKLWREGSKDSLVNNSVVEFDANDSADDRGADVSDALVKIIVEILGLLSILGRCGRGLAIQRTAASWTVPREIIS